MRCPYDLRLRQRGEPEPKQPHVRDLPRKEPSQPYFGHATVSYYDSAGELVPFDLVGSIRNHLEVFRADADKYLYLGCCRVCCFTLLYAVILSFIIDLLITPQAA
jgi:hypothetical protein